MKGSVAIENSRRKLEQEFNERKQKKLEGLSRQKTSLETKLQKVQLELDKINQKINEVNGWSFRDPIPSQDQRKIQSEISKKS